MKTEVKPLPNWLFALYSKLWVAKKSSWFDFEDALKILKIGVNLMKQVIFELKNKGWIETKKHPNNSRLRMYKLTNPEDAVKSIGK